MMITNTDNDQLNYWKIQWQSCDYEINWQTCWSIDRFSEYDQQCSNGSLALVFSSRPIKMSPCFVLGRENVPCVAEVVNRSLKADCTDFTLIHSHLKYNPPITTCKVIHESSVARFPAYKSARAHADHWCISMEWTWPFRIDHILHL